jgi:hypothetical protein
MGSPSLLASLFGRVPQSSGFFRAHQLETEPWLVWRGHGVAFCNQGKSRLVRWRHRITLGDQPAAGLMRWRHGVAFGNKVRRRLQHSVIGRNVDRPDNREYDQGRTGQKQESKFFAHRMEPPVAHGAALDRARRFQRANVLSSEQKLWGP